MLIEPAITVFREYKSENIYNEAKMSNTVAVKSCMHTLGTTDSILLEKLSNFITLNENINNNS